jgi:ribonuclease E
MLQSDGALAPAEETPATAAQAPAEDSPAAAAQAPAAEAPIAVAAAPIAAESPAAAVAASLAATDAVPKRSFSGLGVWVRPEEASAHAQLHASRPPAIEVGSTPPTPERLSGPTPPSAAPLTTNAAPSPNGAAAPGVLPERR